MLVLSRKHRESVIVGSLGDLEEILKVTVLGIVGGCVSLGFEAADNIAVHRGEVWKRLQGMNGHGIADAGDPKLSN